MHNFSYFFPINSLNIIFLQTPFTMVGINSWFLNNCLPINIFEILLYTELYHDIYDNVIHSHHFRYVHVWYRHHSDYDDDSEDKVLMVPCSINRLYWNNGSHVVIFEIPLYTELYHIIYDSDRIQG